MTEEKKKKGKTSVKILELEGHEVTVDRYNWTVDGELHFNSLDGALGEISSQLLKRKLTKRRGKDIYTLDALVKDIKEHNDWFKSLIE